MKRIAFSTLLIASFLQCVALADPAVTVERVDYHGWSNCYRLTNGTVELIVAQQVGRIMRYGFVGGDNALWEQLDTASQTSDEKHWINHGGDKVFPWPQSDWPSRIKGTWPPAFASERQPHDVEIIDKCTLRMTSPVIREYGIRIVRDISMDDTGAGVTLVTRLQRVGPGPEIPLAAWTVTQVPSGASYFARVAAGLPDNQKWEILDNLPWPDVRAIDSNFLEMGSTPSPAKIGINGDLLAAVTKHEVFVEWTTDEMHHMDYPMERAQMFSLPSFDTEKAVRTAGYIELEFTSPRALLAQGESVTLDLRWNLLKLAESDTGLGLPVVLTKIGQRK